MTPRSQQLSLDDWVGALPVGKNSSPVVKTQNSQEEEERKSKRKRWNRDYYLRLNPSKGTNRPFRSPITKEFILSNIEIDPVTGCWNWTRALRKGYGTVGGIFNGKKTTVSVHRASYELFIGPVPEGLLVCHDCPGGDNRRCCNPDHLWAGTFGDNNKDASEKGRTVIPNKKLSDAQAVAIRNDPRRYLVIAMEYGVGYSCVYKIKAGLIYANAK